MIVYKYTNKVNGKVYIGITSRDIETRHKEHMKEVNGKCRFLLHRAIKKYGEDNFELEVIDRADDYEELNDKEAYYINKYKSFVGLKGNAGYNMTSGGGGSCGYTHSLKTRKLLREKKIAFYKDNPPPSLGKPLSEETKQKIGEANKGRLAGEKNPFYGKRHDPETIKKISERNIQWHKENDHPRLGSKWSEEKKKLIGSYHKGKTISGDQRQKLSEMFSGHKNPNSLKVLCITTGEVFNYMGEAAEKYGLDRSNLTKSCRGKTKWCGVHPDTGEQLKWQYFE